MKGNTVTLMYVCCVGFSGESFAVLCLLQLVQKGLKISLTTSMHRHRTCDSDLGAPLRGAVQHRLLHRAHMRPVLLVVDAEDLSVTYTPVSISNLCYGYSCGLIGR